ncbi:YceI family protein [Paracoccus sp. Z118]|uniref:YceI family protein n=1 Tax=Paracoccus sp. Z118 TaxID=2851017 RepID=UPI001C2C2A01|nr:YceI family protein [Paracoccus sp. Z118]MBV0890568.1 YceI family protein [Paracoccus sp. Z118]
MTRIVPVILLAAGLAAPAFAQTAPAPADAPVSAEAAAAAPAADAAAGQAGATIDPSAPAGEYMFDQEHSAVAFTYDHNGMSTSPGLIRGVSGSVTLDPANPENSRVEAMFPLSRIQTVSAMLDEHLGGEDFFAGAAPATAVTFTSTSVEQTGPDTARVTGDLLLNDVTAPVTLDVTLRFLGPNPMTQQPAVGFDATGTLLRSDFNLGAFAPAVSDEVTFNIAVEAARPAS